MMINSDYLALGDSYTIGEGISEDGRWPVLLVKGLNHHGFIVKEARIIAKTGWTTDELMDAVQNENLNQPFDLVSLCIGVNNQYRGRSMDRFRHEFAELVNMSIGFAKNDTARVFVLSIPDWGCTPFARNRNQDEISRQIDGYNLIKKEECRKKNVQFIDITDLTRNFADKPGFLAPDGLHYSAVMHQLWVNAIRDNYRFIKTF